MDENAAKRLPPRLRRILELVYAIEGVGEARVWEWDKGVAVGKGQRPPPRPAIS